jgi:Fe-S-cluster containining protein
MGHMPTLCLSVHAGYGCRRAGACCQNWTVPAEPHVLQVVEARRVRREGVKGPLFVPSTTPGDVSRWNVARDADGSCVFFDRDAGGLCAIHRDAGAGALPSACRHFPRKILRDRRGTFISLSHFCPTAAAMLLARDPLQVVEAHPPLRLAEPVEGLDATDALPPLVRPGVLSDLEGYGAWEQACVATFARADLCYQDALDLVAAATENIRNWRPGSGALSERVHTAFRDARPEMGADADAQSRAIDPRFDVAMKNYLAARVFANWIAYQGRGLRSIVEWLRTCAALVRHHISRRALDTGSAPDTADFVEALRMSDLLLLHAVDTQAIAWRVAALEGPDPR